MKTEQIVLVLVISHRQFDIANPQTDNDNKEERDR